MRFGRGGNGLALREPIGGGVEATLSLAAFGAGHMRLQPAPEIGS